MIRILLLLLFYLPIRISFSQDFFSEPQEWVVKSLTDVKTGKKTNYTSSFLVQKNEITWEQRDFTTKLHIVRIEGEWKDMKKSGSMTLTTRDDEDNILLKFSRRNSQLSIHMQVLPDGAEYVFDVQKLVSRQ